MKTWEELNFNAYNRRGSNSDGSLLWVEEPILEWAECDVLDVVHARQQEYSYGYTIEYPDGGNPVQ